MTGTADEDFAKRRSRLRKRALASGPLVAEMTTALVRVASETPPSDTRDVRDVAASLLNDIPGIEISFHMAEAPVANLVARLSGGRPGPRILISGHLDTYPVGSRDLWSGDPFDGRIDNGFLYGRGSCDMKGGIAASVMAMRLIAEEVPDFPGEIVLALAGDEEAMGERGTQTLIDCVPGCRADAVIVPDVGSPNIVRIGEKGMIWLRLEAKGRSSHGAHTHRGSNAIESLMSALSSLKSLEKIRVVADHPSVSVMNLAEPISEPAGGMGEKETMSRVTVNIGQMGGGTSPNLVPDSAWAELDIRLPAGVTVAVVEARIRELLAEHDHVSIDVSRRYEATWTDAAAPIVRHAIAVATELLEEATTINMRVGASDARLWRRAGMPTIVCGLTPYNLGAADEKLDISELPKLTALLALMTLDFLRTSTP
jgi:succinyl-diaminopimelate desuccinylase